LLKNSNKTPKQHIRHHQQPETFDWTAEVSLITWTTPRKSVDLRDQLRSAQQLQETDQFTQRQLFKKITKGFDEKDSLLAEVRLRIQALETQLEIARPKKRKKVETSPNSKFADIERIFQAQQAAVGVEIEDEGSETSEISVVEADCIVVQ
jgi:hypothetical protein